MKKSTMDQIRRECDDFSKNFTGIERSVFRSGYFIAREAGASKEKALRLATKYARKESTA